MKHHASKIVFVKLSMPNTYSIPKRNLILKSNLVLKRNSVSNSNSVLKRNSISKSNLILKRKPLNGPNDLPYLPKNLQH